MFAVKAPNGRFVAGSASDTMIDAIWSGIGTDENLYEIVNFNGSRDDEAVRKRAKRAGYRTVSVRYRSK